MTSRVKSSSLRHRVCLQSHSAISQSAKEEWSVILTAKTSRRRARSQDWLVVGDSTRLGVWTTQATKTAHGLRVTTARVPQDEEVSGIASISRIRTTLSSPTVHSTTAHPHSLYRSGCFGSRTVESKIGVL